MEFRKILLISCLGILGALSMTMFDQPSTAYAEVCTWKGGNSVWHDPNNWTCSMIPDGDDSAIIDTGTVTVDSDVTVLNLFHSGGTVNGSDALTVLGTFSWTGGSQAGAGSTTVDVGADLDLSGGTKTLNGRSLYNQGSATWTAGNINLYNAATINNSGTLLVQTDKVLNHRGGETSTFYNTGSVSKTASSGTSTFGTIFNNNGTVEVLTGTINFSGGFTQTAGATLLNGGNLESGTILDIQGGLLTGSGTIAGTVSLAGQLKPGLPLGDLTITGDYIQSSTGALDIEIGGSSLCIAFDMLNVGGTATLDGGLNVSLVDGCSPTFGQTFEILTFAARNGDFAFVTGVEPRFTRSFSNTSLILTAGEIPTAPTLDWTGELNYESDGLHPESGLTTDDYVYRIEYADADGDAPNYVRVHIKKGGADIAGSPFTISCATGDYTTGVICSYTKAGLATGTDYTYYFVAEDNQGNPATPTTELDAPDVIDTDPAIVRAGSGTVAPGGSIVIPVEALNVPAVGLGAATIEIHYDNTVLDATGCTADPGSAFDSALCNADYLPDTVRLTAISTLGVSGDLLLAEITFQAVGSSGMISMLDVGIVTFADPSGTPLPSIDEDGEVTIGSDGDVSCDGVTNAVDALFILQREVGLRPNDSSTCPPPADGLYLPACDVSGDGMCNSVDALFILQCEVGIPNPFCPAPGAVTSLRPGRLPGTIPDIFGPLQTATLSIGSGDVEPGGSLAVPLTANLGGETLGAATIEIQYDPAVVDPAGCNADPGNLFDLALCNTDAGPGLVSFTAISAVGVTGDPLLAEITFQAIGDPGDNSPLTLTPTTFADPSGQPISVNVVNGQINIGNTPPILDWTGELNYESDGLHPESGTTSDNYVYRIAYIDDDGDAPNYVRVHIEKGGGDIAGSPFTMSCAGGDYTTGVICSYTKAGLAGGADYTYYFVAEDNQGNPATPTLEKDAPDVGNLDGTVDLQGRSDHSGAEVCAWQSGVEVECTTTDAAGSYAFSLSDGTCDVTVEMALYLDAEKSGVTVVSGETNTLCQVMLLCGDANDDDIINILDLSFMGFRFGLCEGDLDWDPRADCNNDGCGNILDITGAGVNFNKISPVPWLCP